MEASLGLLRAPCRPLGGSLWGPLGGDLGASWAPLGGVLAVFWVMEGDLELNIILEDSTFFGKSILELSWHSLLGFGEAALNLF